MFSGRVSRNAVVVLVAFLLPLSACTRTRPPDVVLIVIDTLRVDRVG